MGGGICEDPEIKSVPGQCVGSRDCEKNIQDDEELFGSSLRSLSTNPDAAIIQQLLLFASIRPQR